MKRILIICCLLQYGCCISLIAQKNETLHKWNITATYLPRLEKHERTRNFQTHYPLSPGLAVEYRINENFAISLGTCLHYEKIKEWNSPFKEPPKIVYGFYTNTSYGIPIQLKYYYTKDKTKKFLPYFKTALINTYHKFYSETLYLSQDLSLSRQDNYYIFWQLGYGVDAKLFNRVSMTTQLAFGFDLRNKSSYKGHIEPLVGLRYEFK